MNNEEVTKILFMLHIPEYFFPRNLSSKDKFKVDDIKPAVEFAANL